MTFGRVRHVIPRSSSWMQSGSPTSAYAPASVQAHLYQSFLHGETADVSLKCFGVTWSASYNLHRVLLIQSQFFRSMFTGGFSESDTGTARRLNGIDVIQLKFDDPNITRPGKSNTFEPEPWILVDWFFLLSLRVSLLQMTTRAARF